MHAESSSGFIAPPWRIWVLEDDAKTREFFVGSLQAHDGFDVVGQAGTVRQALADLADTSLPPDVLLTDLRLPDGSGLQVVAEALRRFPHCDCLTITVFADVDSILESIQAGAVGYILKDVSAAELVEAVLTVKAGGASMTPLIARRMLAAYRQVPGFSVVDGPGKAADAQDTQGASGALSLSPREQSVLSMLSRGFSYREIASLLDVSVNTVQSHIKSLYRKLAVRSRGEAVFEACRLGLLTIGK
ncbi:MAG: response regulator transcription factor [Pigmentiphaga sp.]|nr:response regulator transcription factor [Pigmentiphaga sp.]